MCPKGEKAYEANVEPGVESSLSNVNFSQFFFANYYGKNKGGHKKKDKGTAGSCIPAFVH